MLRLAMPGLFALALVACETVRAPSGTALLNEDQIIDLMEHPKEWDGRLVRIPVYPFDSGFTGSYVICFERCDRASAAKSPFLIYTQPERFRGYGGDRLVIVTARYDSSCQYKSTLCPDGRYGLFTEIY